MRTVFRAVTATLAAGAMAIGSAAPAAARDRGGIDTGDILAGAAIIGGIAAVAAIAGSRNNRHDVRFDRRFDGRGAQGYQRDAVNACVRAAEINASRYTRYSRAEVTQVRDINRRNDGYRIRGRIAVQEPARDLRRNNNWNQGRFTCDIQRGRVVNLDYGGIRGL